jgi:hypothetical protein
VRPCEEGFGPNLVIGLQLFLIATRDLLLLGLFISLNCILYKVSYRSMGTTGDPVPVGQRDVPVNHFTG